MDNPAYWVQYLVGAFGSTGAATLMLAALIFMAYRRDVLRQRNGLKEAHERRDRREDKLLEISERVGVIAEGGRVAMEHQASTNEDLAAAIRDLARTAEERDRRQNDSLRDIIQELRRP